MCGVSTAPLCLALPLRRAPVPNPAAPISTSQGLAVTQAHHVATCDRLKLDFGHSADFSRVRGNILISDKPQLVIPGLRSGTRNLEIEIETPGFRVLPSRAAPE